MSDAVRHCIAELTARRDRLSKIIAELEWFIIGEDLFETQPAAPAAPAAPVIVALDPPKQRKIPTRWGEKTAGALALFKPGVPMTPREIAQHLDINQKLAGDLLSRLCRDGQLTRRSYGTYILDAPAETVLKLEPVTPVKPPPSKHQHMIAHQIPAILEFAAGTLDWFQVTQVEAWLRQHKPELIKSQSQAQDLRVRMIDLARDGKLERRGAGSAAFYRRVEQKEVDNSDARIAVPRDPDAGQF